MPKNLRPLLSLLALGLALTPISSADTLWVYPSIGPSWASANLDIYEVNAVTALEHNVNTTGTPGTPGYYSSLGACQSPNNCNTGTVDPYGIITTNDGTNSYNSWLGNSNPTGNYAGEFGNSIFYGLVVYSPTGFQTQDISFTSFFGDTTLAGVAFSDHAIGCAGTWDYTTATCTGTLYNQSNQGNGDTQQINYLFYSGIFGYDIPAIMTPAGAASDYTALQNTVFTGTYTLPDGTSVTDTQTITPEPATLFLLGFGCIGIGLMRKRTRS